jgi:hypothetical protein
VTGSNLNLNSLNTQQRIEQNKQRGILDDIPIWLKYLVAFVTIFMAVWPIYAHFKSNQYSSLKIEETSIQNTKNDLATTTLNISDLLLKAYSLETTIERQDLLEKYKGDQVYGRGIVKQISRWGNNKFLVDIRVEKNTISCEQAGSEENEKSLLLLKEKIVNFTGTFTYINIFDHGLMIEECQIL